MAVMNTFYQAVSTGFKLHLKIQISKNLFKKTKNCGIYLNAKLNKKDKTKYTLIYC